MEITFRSFLGYEVAKSLHQILKDLKWASVSVAKFSMDARNEDEGKPEQTGTGESE
jgi:hypothetical protein